MECWYCHKLTMLPDAKLGKGWHKCTNCGATWIKSRKVRAPVVKRRKKPYRGTSEYEPAGSAVVRRG